MYASVTSVAAASMVPTVLGEAIPSMVAITSRFILLASANPIFLVYGARRSYLDRLLTRCFWIYTLACFFLLRVTVASPSVFASPTISVLSVISWAGTSDTLGR